MLIGTLPNVLVAGKVYPEDIDKLRYSLFWVVVYTAYFIGIVVFSFHILFTKYKSADGIWKARLKQIITATGIAFLGGILFTLIFPVYFRVYQLIWTGPLFSVFMAAYIWYHIFWKTNRRPKQDSYDPYPY